MVSCTWPNHCIPSQYSIRAIYLNIQILNTKYTPQIDKVKISMFQSLNYYINTYILIGIHTHDAITCYYILHNRLMICYVTSEH